MTPSRLLVALALLLLQRGFHFAQQLAAEIAEARFVIAGPREWAAQLHRLHAKTGGQQPRPQPCATRAETRAARSCDIQSSPTSRTISLAPANAIFSSTRRNRRMRL